MFDFQTVLDGGGYGSYGVASTSYTGALQTVTYEVPTYRFDGARVFTNKPPCGPKRGHGTPQPRFGLELHLDKLAHDAGLDPVDLKRRNFVQPNTRTVNWLRVSAISLSPMPLFPKFVANTTGDEWPTHARLLKVRDWLRANRFTPIQALKAGRNSGRNRAA